jgi:hypothetical protein
MAMNANFTRDANEVPLILEKNACMFRKGRLRQG